jgi:hypothetical protein
VDNARNLDVEDAKTQLGPTPEQAFSGLFRSARLVESLFRNNLDHLDLGRTSSEISPANARCGQAHKKKSLPTLKGGGLSCRGV